MATSAIQHFTGGNAHGPVHMFIADDGRVALVCAIDGYSWELSGGALPRPDSEVVRHRASHQETAFPVDESLIADAAELLA